jgi:hypothetical protein
MTDQKTTTADTVVKGVQVNRSITALPVGPTLAYFKVVHRCEFPEDVPENLKSRFPETVDCGFAHPNDVIAFANDATPTLTSIPLLRVVPPGFRDAARTKGYPTALQEFEKQIVWKGDFMDQFIKGQVDFDDMVYLDNGSHMLFDRNHDVLPTAISFDYLNTHVHSGAYHLEKALEVLAKDPRMIPRPSRDALRRNPGLDKALAVTEAFTFDANYSHSIEFAFAPTPEDMRTIWEKAKSYGTNYPSTMLRQAVFDLDMLGLRAAGAAKYDTFYGSDEPAGSSDE